MRTNCPNCGSVRSVTDRNELGQLIMDCPDCGERVSVNLEKAYEELENEE